MKIAIYGSRHQAPYRESIHRLLRSLSLSGVEIYMDRKLYTHLSDDLGMSLSGIAVAPSVYSNMTGIDLTLSIGGDGTFLRTAAWVGDVGTPILGINTGHLGYLAPLAIEDAAGYIDSILSADYTIEERHLLEVTSPGFRGQQYALNEVVMSKEDSASLVAAQTFIGDKELATYKADGLIVATPTGSTAYNLSAGGPIVQPTAPVIILTPIAAHSLGMRPLVISNDSVLCITVQGRGRSFRLSVDGRSTTLPMGTQVAINRAPFCVRIAQPKGSGFPSVLRSKLMFNV